MNIQGSSIIERRPASRPGGRWFGIVGQVVGVLIFSAVLANIYVYFNQKISEADREMLRLRNQLAGVEREIDSYRLQYERYSAWPYIRDAIRRFNLPLRQATPDQCRRLAMIPPSLAPSIAITFRAADRPTASANTRSSLRPASSRTPNAPSPSRTGAPIRRRYTRN